MGQFISCSGRVMSSTRGNLRGCFQRLCTQSLVLIERPVELGVQLLT